MKITAVQFKNAKLLETALTHRSYLNEHPDVRQSNERLEFLGDSVLSLLTSTQLYQEFPRYPEGKLTSLRASLVRAKTLATAAKKLNLGQYLLMSRGEEKSGGRANPSLLANAFEALIGAIYLDGGLETVSNFLKKNLTLSQDVYDFKSKFQEAVQEKNRVSPEYKIVSETGPDHDKTFTVAVYVGKNLVATGVGKSKQEGEQEAAKLAIENLKFKI